LSIFIFLHLNETAKRPEHELCEDRGGLVDAVDLSAVDVAERHRLDGADERVSGELVRLARRQPTFLQLPGAGRDEPCPAIVRVLALLAELGPYLRDLAREHLEQGRVPAHEPEIFPDAHLELQDGVLDGFDAVGDAETADGVLVDGEQARLHVVEMRVERPLAHPGAGDDLVQ
jgi:hypothetical protein